MFFNFTRASEIFDKLELSIKIPCMTPEKLGELELIICTARNVLSHFYFQSNSAYVYVATGFAFLKTQGNFEIISVRFSNINTDPSLLPCQDTERFI